MGKNYWIIHTSANHLKTVKYQWNLLVLKASDCLAGWTMACAYMHFGEKMAGYSEAQHFTCDTKLDSSSRLNLSRNMPWMEMPRICSVPSCTRFKNHVFTQDITIYFLPFRCLCQMRYAKCSVLKILWVLKFERNTEN